MYQCFEVYKAYGLDKGLLLSLDDYFPTEKEEEMILSSIKNLDCVEDVRFLESITQVMAISGDDGIYLMNVTEDLKEIPWRVVSGRMINRNSKNEICLSSNFMHKYSVGENLSVTLWDGDSYNGELTIVGFFDVDSYMPNDMGTFRYEIDSWDNNGIAYAFTCNLTTNDGSIVQFGNSELLFIRPKEGYSIEIVKSSINSIGINGIVRDYSDYKEYVYNRNKDTNDMVSLFCIASITLMITVLSAFTVIQISVNKMQLVVYCINGCTWAKAVGIACFSNLPFLIIGIVLGGVAYTKIPLFSLMTNGDYMWDTRAFIFVTITMIIVYFSLCGFFYIYTCRESITEQIRRE